MTIYINQIVALIPFEFKIQFILLPLSLIVTLPGLVLELIVIIAILRAFKLDGLN